MKYFNGAVSSTANSSFGNQRFRVAGLVHLQLCARKTNETGVDGLPLGVELV